MPRLRLILALLAASAVRATPVIEHGTSCDAFVDPREIRMRIPDRVVTGRIVSGSLHEPDLDPVEVGQQIIFGTGELTPNDGGPPLAISYIYVRSGACTGWAPGHGGRFTFDLLDDHAANGALRVMRYAPASR